MLQFVSAGPIVTIKAAAALKAGVPALFGADMPVIPQTAAAVGADCAAVAPGVSATYANALASGAIAAGDRIYLKIGTEDEVSSTAADGKSFGYALTAAADGARLRIAVDGGGGLS